MPMCKDLLLCETSSGTPRPFVPEHFRNIVFNSLHFLSHPGIRATQRLMTSRFFWPGMNADVRRWARSCLQCQRAKVHRHTTTPLGTFNTPDVRFDHVHIDLVGPLPTSQGCTYLHLLTDSLAGQKPSLYQTQLLPQWHKHSSMDGYLVSAFPLLSPPTEVNNLNLHCGNT